MNQIDYYSLLRIPPFSELETIERVYKILRERHSEEQDWVELLEAAFRTLSDPEARARYDADRMNAGNQPIPVFQGKEFRGGISGEANRRMGLLCLLYDSRRADFERPGISLLRLEELVRIPREHLMFTMSYLRERGQVTVDQNSDFVITSAGMDFVESHLEPDSVFAFILAAGEQGRLQTAASKVGAVGEGSGS